MEKNAFFAILTSGFFAGNCAIFTNFRENSQGRPKTNQPIFGKDFMKHIFRKPTSPCLSTRLSASCHFSPN